MERVRVRVGLWTWWAECGGKLARDGRRVACCGRGRSAQGAEILAARDLMT